MSKRIRLPLRLVKELGHGVATIPPQVCSAHIFCAALVGRKGRESFRLSVVRLAKRAKLSAHIVYAFERGEIDLDTLSLVALARAIEKTCASCLPRLTDILQNSAKTFTTRTS